MRLHNVLLVTIALGLSGGLLLSATPLAHAVDVQSSVQLGAAATCGLQVSGGSPINYGTLTTANSFNPEPGARLTIQNTGTTAKALVTAKGTDWIGTAPAGVVMSVHNTRFGIPALGATAPPPFSIKTQLTAAPVGIGSNGYTVAPGALQDIYWQVQFILNAGVTYTGTASQTVTLDSTCQ